MKYDEQLYYKQKQVKDAIQRIGKIENATSTLSCLPGRTNIIAISWNIHFLTTGGWMTVIREKDQGLMRMR